LGQTGSSDEEEARAALANVRARLTEVFGTADLRPAGALLHELSAR
jgi:hypothetical protein